MIIDSLKNSARYEYLNPRFKRAFEFIKSLNVNTFVPGKIEIDGDQLFVNASDGNMKKPEEAPLETHIEYIDIQVPLNISEAYGWKDSVKCISVTEPYNPEKDIAFYADSPSTYFTLEPGEFVIFFPEDAHAPFIGEGQLKKLIVKVKI
ncbi:MAG: YhcH/YjgK/YiaL family protein [Dysgonamonadaceae bacterium]|jgi:YhcH/YjgK/YiaL family protein|nr:YhcH/YjgK/YiaL family protein [Dysgonamonadaceae bacterium]